MKISFFEEFPTSENIARAALVDFPSTVYVAAPSLDRWSEAAAAFANVNARLELAYWPILPCSYWLSPFSCPREIAQLVKELRSGNIEHLSKILIDLELPRQKRLCMTNLRHSWANRRAIEHLFAAAPDWGRELHTAEYPGIGDTVRAVLRALGLSYRIERYRHKRIVMLYTSMIPAGLVRRMKRQVAREARRYGEHLLVGLGTIATGILGNEPILTPQSLAADLAFARETGIAEVVIFRLGGLDEAYRAVLERFL